MSVNSDSRPRTKPAEVRREDLMNSAERLFLQMGVEKTAIEAITRGAGVAKGTFYLHFSSKTDVLEALRDRFVQSLLNKIVAEVARRDDEDWHGRLAAWSRACCIGYIDAARLHHLVFVAAPPSSRDGLSRNMLIDHLMGLLIQGTDRKAWAIDDPRFTAVFLFSALHGVIHQAEIGEKRREHRRLLDAVASHFLRSVGPAPGGEPG